MNMSSSNSWAELGKDLIDSICNKIDLEDIPWKGGDFDIDRFIEIYMIGRNNYYGKMK